ncbi:hypothetical protein GWK08_17565 [Leptobacterium flavescens]|uniref:Uncharacterized protein n=1 Tax=Leptobacterium flavescens TaxID=472055 RepID=A0A6P0UTV4_9FLAO|nr:hypothetical protein [Leptobacterium flavescens]NER15269.1 hypothetical protein [Leptobacterium flavescens]
MKSKTLLTLLFLIGFTGSVYTQTENTECKKNLYIFVEHAKVGNYDAAYEPWKMVRENCPELHSAIYSLGEKILEDKIKKSSGGDKTSNVNLLMEIYDEEHKYFPDKFKLAVVLSDKALLMFEQKIGSDQEIYDLLHRAFTGDRANFKNPRALYLYFSTLVNLHKSGSKELQLVFDTYDDVEERIEIESKSLSGTIDRLLPKEEAGSLTSKETKTLKRVRTNNNSYNTIKNSIDSKLGALADCANLIPLYQKNFDAKKGDAVWLNRAAGRMANKDCDDDPLFVQLVEALHQLEPSANSAYYLGILNDKKGNSSEAIKYYNESVDLETDNYRKARILTKIAGKYQKRGQFSTARNYAQRAIDIQPSNGRAYLLIAKMYADSANKCGTTPFEKRAIYWKAAELARRARRVDPSLKSIANRAIEGYEGRAPSKTDIFNAGMAGKTITFKCWVSGSVTVPKL